jgi:hypothetical protein
VKKKPKKDEVRMNVQFWAAIERLKTLLGRMDEEMDAQDKRQETMVEKMKRLDIRSIKGGKT